MNTHSTDFTSDIPNITTTEHGIIQIWHPENPEILLAELGNVQARQYAHQLLEAVTEWMNNQ